MYSLNICCLTKAKRWIADIFTVTSEFKFIFQVLRGLSYKLVREILSLMQLLTIVAPGKATLA